MIEVKNVKIHDEWLEKIYPMEQDLDGVITALAIKFDHDRHMRRVTKKKTLFRLTTEQYGDGEWRTVKAPWSQQVKEYLQKKYGDKLGEILNVTLGVQPA